MRSLKIFILACVFGFLGYMVFAITFKYTEGEALRKRISTIPSFRFEQLGNGYFTDADLPVNRHLILLYFNSSCEFCQAESREVKNKIGKFKDVQWVFVSTEEKSVIKNFAEEYGLYGNANVIFLQDSNLEFSRIFGVSTVPATYIYNKEQQLIKKFKGAVKIASLLEAIQEKP